MIGIPEQSLSDIKEMLNLIETLKPEHVSTYSLIVEENTQIYSSIKKQELTLPDEETERQMYWLIKNELENLGYEHYEISNFAQKGYYSRHNTDCWEQKEYIGFGSSAHSYTDNVRYSNIDNIEKYIENYKNDKQEDNIIFHEKQNQESKIREYIILGLRKIDGIDLEKFKNKFGIEMEKFFKSEIESLLKKELIVKKDNKIKLTNKGIDLANIVWEEFI